MSGPADAVTLQFLDWVDRTHPGQPEVLDAWQTSCPRLSIWEDAVIDGLVAFDGGRERRLVVTLAGRARLTGTGALSGQNKAERDVSAQCHQPG